MIYVILFQQAAEEQRLRQAKLADDFRERALQDMMDGVLEKHWTDVIKKEIPKPDCMLLKTPDRYTEEDKLAVQRYEQDLKNLEENRETYRKTLRAEFAKVNQTLKQSIGKFNARLREFHVVSFYITYKNYTEYSDLSSDFTSQMRLRLDSAILQLDLRRCRYSLRHGTRVKELYKVDDLKSKIKEKYQLVSGLSENVSLLKNVDLVMQENYENLGVKDKYMERKLKNDFPTLSKTAFDALNKQYKRRPRIFIKTVSPHEVTDLAKSIISMVKPSYMTKECLEYLKQLGNLDVRPQGLPDSVEPTHWENLVALRRLKVTTRCVSPSKDFKIISYHSTDSQRTSSARITLGDAPGRAEPRGIRRQARSGARCDRVDEKLPDRGATDTCGARSRQRDTAGAQIRPGRGTKFSRRPR